jgi:hypothetical protein
MSTILGFVPPGAPTALSAIDGGVKQDYFDDWCN